MKNYKSFINEYSRDTNKTYQQINVNMKMDKNNSLGSTYHQSQENQLPYVQQAFPELLQNKMLEKLLI